MGIYNNKLMFQISQIIKRCNEDLKKDTIQTRDSYYQIKAFHYDNIEKLVRKAAEEEEQARQQEGSTARQSHRIAKAVSTATLEGARDVFLPVAMCHQRSGNEQA